MQQMCQQNFQTVRIRMHSCHPQPTRAFHTKQTKALIESGMDVCACVCVLCALEAEKLHTYKLVA